MPLQRRDFLKHIMAASVAGSSLGLGGTALSAFGADTSGYKALVCVFLFGGLDNHDFLLPFDASDYQQFAQLRQTLLATQGASRARESLLPLSPVNATPGDSRWALPPEMPLLKGLFDSGEANLVANVGPLIEPVSRQSFLDESVRLPPRLFSHNDQQATWQASAPEGAQFGWGGLFADAVTGSISSSDALAFSTITSAGGGPFLTGRRAFPYQINPGGAAEVFLLEEFNDFPGGVSSALRNHLQGGNYLDSHIIRRDMKSAHGNAFSANDSYNAAKSGAAPLTTAFPETELGSQLRAVAETIAIRDQLGVSRQVFFVGMGGFDTHSAQATALPQLLAQIDGAVGAFNSAMKELAVNEQVTLFSASEFGRTLAVNGDGTDHGWGGHQFVVGGAVNGGQLLGAVPPPVYDHALDSGGGRLIPQYAVEQFAHPLGRWFGLTDDEVQSALPALSNFNDPGWQMFRS
ncbi:MAG: DUF1501 domain-containing protein [Pseudomonadota bacterium]